MSENVDNRIVQMEFDDAQFREGVSSTIKSIKELDKSLELENGAESINRVAKELKNVDTSGMERGLDRVSVKFSVMQAAAFTAVNNITTRLMGMAENVAKSVTIQPLLDGLDEYKLKLDSIKTIQTNTAKHGTTMEQITQTLDELNKYADQTIYKFSDMTTNIGKFTAAGVGLEESAIAIKGISNLAAASGASANDASRAMYNLSQALATGSLKLIDWNSVVNANMGGQLFQNALIRTARTMGIAVDEAIEKTGSFRDSLKEEWITSDVLIKTLEGFTMATEGATEAQIAANRAKLEGIGFSQEAIDEIFAEANAAQSAAIKVKTFQQLVDTTQEALGSGWATTWELIIGNLEEAENFWTKISVGLNGFIDAMSDSRNDLLKSWRAAGGRDTFIDHILSGFQKLTEILGQVEKATNKIFSNNLGKYADGMSTYFHRWTTFFSELEPLFSTVFSRIETITYPATMAIYRVGGAVRELLIIVERIVNPVVQAFDEVFGSTITDGAKSLSQGIGLVSRTLRMLRPSVSVVEMLHDVAARLFETVKPGIDVFMWLFNVAKQLGSIGIKGLAIAFEGVVQTILALMDALSPIGEAVGEIFSAIFGETGKAGDEILGSLKSTNKFLDTFLATIRKGIPQIKAFFEPLKAWAKDVANAIRQSGAVEWFKENLPRAMDLAKAAFDALVPVFANLVEFATSLAMTVGTNVVTAFQMLGDVISSTGVGDFIGSLAGRVGDLLGVSKAFADTGDAAQQSSSKFDRFASSVGSALGTAGQWILGAGQQAIQFLGMLGTLVWNTVSPAIEWLGDLFTQLGEIIQNVAENFDFGEAFTEFLKNAGEKAEDFFKLFEEGAPNLMDLFKFLGDVGGDFGAMFMEILPQFGSFMGAIGEEVSGATDGPLADLGNFIQNLRTNLEAIPGIITAIPATIGNTIGNIFESLTKSIKNPFAIEKAWADTGEGGDTGLGGITEQVAAFQEEGFVLSKAINNITTFLKTPMETARKTVKDTFVGGMKGIAEGLNEGLSAISFENISLFIENCKNVVVSFSALWGTISLISVFESVREIFLQIAKWSESVTGVINSVAGVFKSISKVFDTIATNVDKIGDAVAKSIRANNFLKYAIGTIFLLGAVVAAIVVLGRMDENELKRGAIAAGSILGALIIYSALMMLVSKLDKGGKGTVKSLAGLTGMGLALLMVARSIAKLGAIPEDELIRGGIAVGVMILLLGLMGSLVGAKSAEGLKGAALLLAFGFVLRTLAATLALYALAPWEQYGDGLAKVAIVLGLLWVVMMGVAWAGRISKGSLAQAAAAIGALSACLILMAAAIGIMRIVTMGQNPLETLIMTSSLVLLMVGMAGSLALLGWFGGPNLLKSAAAMGILSIVLFAMVGAIAVLSLIWNLNPENIIASTVVLIGMMYAMVGALYLLGNKTRQLKSAREGIQTMTIALGAIAIAMTVLTFVASYNIGAFIASAIALGALMFAMAGSLILVGRYGAKIDAAVPAIWTMTLAIAAIGAAISAMMFFSGGDVAGIAVSGIVLAGMLIVLAAAISILSKEGLKADMAATAMLELSVALGVMALAIALLGSMPLSSLVQGFVGLVAATLLLGVAAAAITALSGVMLPAAGVLALLGVGLIAVAGAFYIFVAALEKLAGVAPEAFQSIIDSKDQMVGAFAAMGEAIAVGIMSFFGALINGIGQGMSQMAVTVSSHGPEIGTAAISVGKALGEGIIYGVGGMVLGIGQAILGAIGNAVDFANNGSGVANINPELMYDDHEWSAAAREAGQTSVEEVAQSATESDAPKKAGEEVAQELHDGAVEAADKQDPKEIMNAMFGDLEGMDIPPEIKGQLEGQFSEMFDQNMFSDLGGSLGGVIPGGILEGASNNPIDIGSMMQGMNLTTASFEPNAKETGSGIGNAVSAGAAETMADASPVNAAIDSQLGAISARTGDYQARGNESGTQYGQGVNTGIFNVDINGAIVANTAKMAAALEPARSTGTAVGNAFGTGEGAGISAMSWVVSSTAQSVTRSAGENADGYDSGYHPGYWFGEGMADGISSRSSSVATAAENLVKAALEAADKEANSHSPSQKMIQRGQWFGEGYAIGMKMTGSLVASQAADLTTMAIDEARTSFSVMDTFLNSIDWNADPVITPILDTSQYESAFSSMSSFDTTPMIQSSRLANRIGSGTSMGAGTQIQNGGSTFNITLDWKAGTTPNQMVQQLANELEMWNATQGR